MPTWPTRGTAQFTFTLKSTWNIWVILSLYALKCLVKRLLETSYWKTKADMWPFYWSTCLNQNKPGSVSATSTYGKRGMGKSSDLTISTTWLPSIPDPLWFELFCTCSQRLSVNLTTLSPLCKEKWWGDWWMSLVSFNQVDLNLKHCPIFLTH